MRWAYRHISGHVCLGVLFSPDVPDRERGCGHITSRVGSTGVDPPQTAAVRRSPPALKRMWMISSFPELIASPSGELPFVSMALIAAPFLTASTTASLFWRLTRLCRLSTLAPSRASANAWSRSPRAAALINDVLIFVISFYSCCFCHTHVLVMFSSKPLQRVLTFLHRLSPPFQRLVQNSDLVGHLLGLRGARWHTTK